MRPGRRTVDLSPSLLLNYPNAAAHTDLSYQSRFPDYPSPIQPHLLVFNNKIL